MSTKLKFLFSNPPTFQSLHSKPTTYEISFPPDSKVTKQSFGPECDINTIMARYQSTGEMPVLNQVAPQYLDLDQTDFQAAMEVVAGAQSLFADLPSAIRTRFHNDPGEFLAFTSNPANRPEMQALGMLSAAASIPSPSDQQTAASTKSATSMATSQDNA
nr:MAG: internal scaffolding protein [Microvirus sp.]